MIVALTDDSGGKKEKPAETDPELERIDALEERQVLSRWDVAQVVSTIISAVCAVVLAAYVIKFFVNFQTGGHR